MLWQPPAALCDDRAIELARAWIAEQGLHCALKFGLQAEDALERETMAWGIIPADLASHVADALGGEGLGPGAGPFAAIVEGFDGEVASATSRRTGGPGSGPGSSKWPGAERAHGSGLRGWPPPRSPGCPAAGIFHPGADDGQTSPGSGSCQGDK
ncbi:MULTISPECIES: DUF5076 domain-containing protein [unclassified Caulobacter]|uniref:DUF5076 domain-containing protein n=1 Tax=unclassified Caulobacter TaxID=2648921 RepID=UPI000D399FF2|nr:MULTISPECIES: DUF5076 domain-containing protein [unclassified Caulobacter]PTS88377.1 hypothetical protein DBR21_09675 [Caulobacter sp. HMWF009]PTT13152.1 hypothetical protein DBR10_00070 [Caulobacter sp. HMWF025]